MYLVHLMEVEMERYLVQLMVVVMEMRKVMVCRVLEKQL